MNYYQYQFKNKLYYESPYNHTLVTALQGMLAISAFGLIEQFNTWKASLDPVLDFEVITFLDKAQHWGYDSPVLNAALLLLGIEEHKDALFELASTL
jgi:hypothetical protein